MNPVDIYINSLKAGGASDQTISRFRQMSTQFHVSVKHKKICIKNDVLNFLASLRDKEFSGSYLRFCWHILKGFYLSNNWEWFTRDEEKRLRPKKSEPNMPFLTIDETRKIIEKAKQWGKEKGAWDIYARVRIAARTPIRREELHRLNREHYKKPVLNIPTAKHGAKRPLTLDEETCNALDKYLEKLKRKRLGDKDALFLSTHKTRISLSELSAELQKLLKECNIYRKGLGWHGIRRGCVTMLFKAGMKEKEIKEYGGWKTSEMVGHYIQLDQSEIQDKAQKIHPIFKKN